MNASRHPAVRPPQFRAELSPAGEAGIRDHATDLLHPSASVEDALVDATYLSDQARAGNRTEVAAHLAFVAELAAAKSRHRSAPGAPPGRDSVLAAASQWQAERHAAAAAELEHARARALVSSGRSLDAAAMEAHLAAAAVMDGIRDLYADPEAAQRVLSDTSVAVPLPDLAALIRSEPAAFGPLAEPRAGRFGQGAAREELVHRTGRLAAALEASAAADASYGSALAAAAAAIGADPATPAEVISATLASRASAGMPRIHPDHARALARAADHLRALLATAEEKTTDAVLQRFPEASTLAREARVLPSVSRGPEH